MPKYIDAELLPNLSDKEDKGIYQRMIIISAHTVARI